MFRMEESRVCSPGLVGTSLKCPLEDCAFRTKAVSLEFKDLLRSEIDQHMLDFHKEIKKAMRQVCFLGHDISTPGGKCKAGQAKEYP